MGSVMRVMEGRGFVLRTGVDAPFCGWVSARQLDAIASIQAAPWMAVRSLCELARLLPGGLALLWDLPPQALAHVPQETRVAFWTIMEQMPGMHLHVKDATLAEHLEGPIQGWFHASEPPGGAMGQAWRQGWIGWVPEGRAEWSMPGMGRTEADPAEPFPPGWTWGEVILPLGALKEIDAEELSPLLAETQAGLERNLSLRISAKAWPLAFPFQRRRTGWRVSVLGGREYAAANGDWIEAAERLGHLREALARALKCPVQVGPCHDPEAASLLGHQAMREGHPWRYSLPIPPASPSFTPGLGADPRETAPPEFRGAFPEALVPLLSDPPAAFLRLPSLPQEASVNAFLRGQKHLPAIRWIPPEVAPPGPFLHERPWAASSAYLPLADVTQALQPSLFEDLGGSPEELG